MTRHRPTLKDPRTIARDIPGVMESLFPQLTPGVVLHLNSRAFGVDGCESILSSAVSASGLQGAMLFEIAFAVGEQLLTSPRVDWASALDVAADRQRTHFDARIPAEIGAGAKDVAFGVGGNILKILKYLSNSQRVVHSPVINGYQWVSSGNGDFAFGSTLVEVKCTARRFGAADYRQILIYWLLSYAASIEGIGDEWGEGCLINPRLNLCVKVEFDELISITAGGRSKVELLEVFSWLVGDYSERAINHA